MFIPFEFMRKGVHLTSDDDLIRTWQTSIGDLLKDGKQLSELHHFEEMNILMIREHLLGENK